jgi:hypothetical protein
MSRRLKGDGNVANFIMEDAESVRGFVEDTLDLGRNRRLAEDVRVLISVVVRQQSATRDRAATLSASLEKTKQLLRQALEPPAQAVKAKTFHIEWGQPLSPEGKRATPKLSERDSLQPDAGEIASPTVQPHTESTKSPDPDKAVSPGRLPNRELIDVAIDLCDWLDRVREDERIAPGRAAGITNQKAGSLLAALGVERVEQEGVFDGRYQQIVDCVATDSATKNMHVCQTVRCGYRATNQIIRPQLVMVYRLEPDQPAAEVI